MPYGGGIFLPSETAYKDPNRFKDVLQAEGNKEAQYLASMDQFFEELSEMKRQFEVTSEQRERFFEEEMAFGREKLEAQSAESALDRSLKRYEIGAVTSASRFAASEAAGASRYATERRAQVTETGFAVDLAKLGLAKEAQAETSALNKFMRGLYTGEETRRQEVHEVGLSRVGGRAETSSGITGTSSYYNPYSGESISEYMNQDY